MKLAIRRRGARCLAAFAVATWPALAAADGFECLIEPWQTVEVRSPVDGIIESIAVDRGDPVRHGQPLVVLQSAVERSTVESARQRAQAEGQIASARNRIEYSRKKLARIDDLQKGNFVSPQVRDEAEAEKRLAEAELQSATESRDIARVEWRRMQELLALRTMSAPFNGVVVERLLNPGDLAESGSGRRAVLKVAQIDPMRADVPLPAALFGQVRAGASATVTALVGGTRHPATVRRVDRLIDAASMTFIARLEVPNPKGIVPGGSRCTATIQGATPPARAPAKPGPGPD